MEHTLMPHALWFSFALWEKYTLVLQPCPELVLKMTQDGNGASGTVALRASAEAEPAVVAVDNALKVAAVGTGPGLQAHLQSAGTAGMTLDYEILVDTVSKVPLLA
jgi:hypothetical protein